MSNLGVDGHCKSEARDPFGVLLHKNHTNFEDAQWSAIVIEDSLLSIQRQIDNCGSKICNNKRVIRQQVVGVSALGFRGWRLRV